MYLTFQLTHVLSELEIHHNNVTAFLVKYHKAVSDLNYSLPEGAYASQ